MSRIRSAGFSLFAVVSLLAFAGVGCGPKYPKCDKDSHCEEKGEVCVEGLCQQCRDDSNCEAGQQCKGGRCEAKPECSTNEDCSGNKICRSGKCQIECNQSSDCGSGLKCVSNRCVDALSCGSTADCEAGMACVAGRCQAQSNQAMRTMCDWPSVRFDFNRARLGKDAKDGLERIADCLKTGGGTIIIEGHCDERGTEEYNLALGDRRARAVGDYLKRLGVPASKFRVVSKGETEPADDGHDEGAWATNRRVEFEQP